jgi:hypothetical protein
MQYLTSLGGQLYWVGLVFLFVAQQFGSILVNCLVRVLSDACAESVVYEPITYYRAPNTSHYFGIHTFLLVAYLIVGFLRLWRLPVGCLTASARIYKTFFSLL